MTIDEVYRLVQTFANKEQRGFITPSEFNLLAKQAELELYNKRLSLIKEKNPTRKSQGIYAEGLCRRNLTKLGQSIPASHSSQVGQGLMNIRISCYSLPCRAIIIF